MNDGVRVAGHWEQSYNKPEIEINYWNLPLRDFGVKELYMHPIVDVFNNEEKRVHLYQRETFKEILEENQDVPHVYFEPRLISNFDSILLPDFNHPKDVLYIFGSAHFNPVIGHKREQDIVVTIPTIHNRGVLWPDQCILIVLYDRLIKNERIN